MSTVSPMAGGPASATYASKVWSPLLGAFVGSAIASAVVIDVMTVRLPVPGIRDAGWDAVIGLILVGVLVALFLAFWMQNLSVVISTTSVTVRRPFHVLASFHRAGTSFRSTVITHRTTGLPSATTRTLIATRTDGTSSVFTLNKLPPETFSELLDHLNPARPGSDLTGDLRTSPSATPAQNVVFTVDASSMIRTRRTLTFFATLVTLAVVATEGAIGVQPLRAPSLPFVAVLIAGPFVIGLLIAVIIVDDQVRRFPRAIRVNAHDILIDDQQYPFSELSRVWVTAPTHQTKQITIEQHDGRTARRLLETGNTHMRQPYTEFVRTLAEATATRRGLLGFDRG
ncbi:hypothetical protein [Microbacterium sp. Leaf320]|uniref:hypothetical protein n=1 Tax=Microbacterium sp. Leaf320 TaxID=1736334 RepID=UPI0006FFE8EB|nr:hypothetical protein [Microbacterium sp. Leaf320]KQQ62661.1 hypothetical protein ASF63_18030 [Microbacterium sp. Leaf320]